MPRMSVDPHAAAVMLQRILTGDALLGRQERMFDALAPVLYAEEMSGIADAAIAAFGDIAAAEEWLVSTHPLLNSLSPIEAAAKGQAENVLRILALIRYGGVV